MVLAQLAKLANPQWLDFKDLELLLEILKPAKIVGGAVRNGLLGLSISDIDLATELKPEDVIKIASSVGFKVIPTGLQHGTVTCVKHKAYEVTTLRIDKQTDGRHAVVEFSNSWEEDANRRDFTINALYSDFYGNIYDYCDGIQDIENRTLRFIGNPYDRIKEDYLRILRFFRFLAHYCDNYDDQSLSACTELGSNLKSISRERCTSEFLKILAVKDPRPTLSLISSEILKASGLPAIKETTMMDLNLDLSNHFLSLIGKLSTFSKHHEMVLSRKERNLLNSLHELKPMYNLNEYVFWVNTADPEIVWDGIILKGKNNETIITVLDKWLTSKFDVSGKDLIKLGYKAGPEIGRELEKMLFFFCEQTEPLTKEDLIKNFYQHTK